MRTKKELAKYIKEMKLALKHPAARETYFPPDIELRRTRNFKLARETGAALRDFDQIDVNRIIGNLYGEFIVAASLDTTGVVIDASEFIEAIKTGIAREAK